MVVSELPVSIVIPVKNEEKNIADCLESLKAFSEIVVVDSGSDDRTCALAESAGARVVQFRWDGKFPKKRNWILRNHDFQNPWILFLDADERPTPEFVRELQRELPSSKQHGYWLTYHNYFMNRLMKHGDRFRKLALIRKGSGEYERIDEESWSHLDMEIHEHPVINGSVGTIQAPIIHNDYRGLHRYIDKHNEYSDWEAKRYVHNLRSADASKVWSFRQKIKHWLIRSPMVGPVYFVYAYLFRLGFLDGREGFFFCLMKMAYFTQVAAKIHELREEEAEP